MLTWLIGLLIFLFMLAMVFLGIPVFVSMLVAAFAGFAALYSGNLTMALTQFTNAPFNLGANYNFAVLPMFMLLGALAGETGVAEGAFTAVKAFLGRVTGGLLYTVIGANAIFGACSGSSIAGNIVFGKLALPELEKAGYDRKYSLGCIAASGALSTLIPPSMGIIMFCLIAPSPIMYKGQNMNLSVGSALVGGIGPGILTMLALMLTVYFIGKLKPGTLPKSSGPKVPALVKIKSLGLLLPIIFLFGLIIGGTMLGWFTATVAGAVGATAICIYALVKKISIKKLWLSIWDATLMEAGIFPIIIGGQIFGRFIADTGLAETLSAAITSIKAPPIIIFLIVMGFYVFMGCVADVVTVIIITVPVMFPMLCNLGFSPYVIIICLCFMTELDGLTPPIGMNVFATANALRVNASEIFAGVMPFFIVENIMVLLIAVFPQIVTFIPKLMGISGF
ncbi:MAG: TRAP transporter large permease [Clostridiales bacterium]|nr:TRAP transporter large permease [Clostridiales bacterium]